MAAPPRREMLCKRCDALGKGKCSPGWASASFVFFSFFFSFSFSPLCGISSCGVRWGGPGLGLGLGPSSAEFLLGHLDGGGPGLGLGGARAWARGARAWAWGARAWAWISKNRRAFGALVSIFLLMQGASIIFFGARGPGLGLRLKTFGAPSAHLFQ